jgi:hypothetical protein
MIKSLALLSLLVSTGAAAQAITSYRTDNPAPVKGDSDKIVCQKQETIGTRLGAKKVCMTVAEWNDRRRDQREETEKIQSLACMPGEGQDCASPQ